MKQKSKDTHCILPYIHLYAEPTGLVKPCCIGGEFKEELSLRNKSVEEVINSPQMRQLRKDMSEGTRNSVCNVCYEREDRGEISPRNDFNKNTLWKMPEVGEDYSVPTTALQHIDIRFSNLCNFKCRMCNHTFSSEWYKEQPLVEHSSPTNKIEEQQYVEYWRKENPSKVIKVKEGIVSELKPHLENVKSWYFAGGEPLITPEHAELLNHLHTITPFQDLWGEQKKNISIHYNTNLSILKFEKYNFLDIWFDFAKIFLSISCDGIGKIGEYQRTGFKTDVFLKNLQKIRKYFKPGDTSTTSLGYNYNFQYTTTVYNVYHIWDFYQFMMDNGYIENERNIDFYYAWAPSRSALKSLPKDEKVKVISYLESLLTKFKEPLTLNKIQSMIEFTKVDTSNGETQKEFFGENRRLDSLRGTDMTSTTGIKVEQLRPKIGSYEWRQNRDKKNLL